MALSDLASIGSFVSAVAVLISLVYLSVQIRQSERNQRAIIQQGRATRSSDLLLRIAEAGMVEANYRGRAGDENITQTELHQFLYSWMASLAGFEDVFIQRAHKLMDEDSFESMVMIMRFFFTQPGTRAMWKLRRIAYSSGFAAFIDNLISEVEVAQPVDLLARWKAELGAERADAIGAPVT